MAKDTTTEEIDLKDTLKKIKYSLIEATETLTEDLGLLPVKDLDVLVNITIKLENSLEDGAGVGTLAGILKSIASDC